MANASSPTEPKILLNSSIQRITAKFFMLPQHKISFEDNGVKSVYNNEINQVIKRYRDNAVQIYAFVPIAILPNNTNIFADLRTTISKPFDDISNSTQHNINTTYIKNMYNPSQNKECIINQLKDINIDYLVSSRPRGKHGYSLAELVKISKNLQLESLGKKSDLIDRIKTLYDEYKDVLNEPSW